MSTIDQAFNTVASMKAAALTEGDCVMTRGYYAAGDGGQRCLCGDQFCGGG